MLAFLNIVVGISGGCTWAQQALQSGNSWVTRRENVQMSHNSQGSIRSLVFQAKQTYLPVLVAFMVQPLLPFRPNWASSTILLIMLWN